MSRHLKKYAAPTSWPVTRKDRVYITKTMPGPHSIQQSLNIALILKMLGYAQTTREIKKILNTKEILVDGRKTKEPKFPAGLLDVLSIPSQNQQFRIIYDSKGRLQLAPIKKEEINKKIAKIIGKKALQKGQIQINLSDGRNFITKEKTYNVGDSLLIEVPSQKIIEHLKLEKGSCIYLTDGKHISETGIAEEITPKIITYTNAETQKEQTSTKYACVVGKKQPIITLK